jgi:hypothetical protein
LELSSYGRAADMAWGRGEGPFAPADDPATRGDGRGLRGIFWTAGREGRFHGAGGAVRTQWHFDPRAPIAPDPELARLWRGRTERMQDAPYRRVRADQRVPVGNFWPARP